MEEEISPFFYITHFSSEKCGRKMEIATPKRVYRMG